MKDKKSLADGWDAFVKSDCPHQIFREAPDFRDWFVKDPEFYYWHVYWLRQGYHCTVPPFQCRLCGLRVAFPTKTWLIV